ncbi:hypothetical protein Tco_0939208 [Tanacetum coccineum]|uniref:Uncharacterized protein n=1 Tax=Tanacetum coccineum TaxID=301880 RepID=A0ABQ5DM21_9ASTR
MTMIVRLIIRCLLTICDPVIACSRFHTSIWFVVASVKTWLQAASMNRQKEFADLTCKRNGNSKSGIYVMLKGVRKGRKEVILVRQSSSGSEVLCRVNKSFLCRENVSCRRESFNGERRRIIVKVTMEIQEEVLSSSGNVKDHAKKIILTLTHKTYLSVVKCCIVCLEISRGVTHEVHEMQSDVQHNYVVDSDADYTSDSNIIPYDQYVEDNEEHIVQSNVSSVRNDALMSILDEMHEQGVQSMSINKPDKVVNDLVTSELARYKELVGVYEQRAKFELTDRERKN